MTINYGTYTKVGDRWRIQLGPKHGRISKTCRTKAQCETWAKEVIEGGSNTKIKVKELIPHTLLFSRVPERNSPCTK